MPVKNITNNKEDKKQSLLGSLFSYVAKPYYLVEVVKKGARGKFWDIFRLWSLAILGVGFFGYLIGLAIEMAGYDMSQHSVVDLFLNYPIYLLIFFAFIWAPITEELTFRLGLKYSPYRLSFSLVFLGMLLAVSIITLSSDLTDFIVDWIVKLAQWEIFTLYVGLTLLAGWSLGKFLQRRLNKERVEKFYSRNFHHLFYGAVILFAVVHIFNFADLGRLWFLAPLLIIPQLILGFILGYVRMKYGLRWSMIFHFLHNALLSTPVIIFTFVSDELFAAVESGDEEALNAVPASDMLLVLLATAITILVFIAVVIALISLAREHWRGRQVGAKIRERVDGLVKKLRGLKE